jgi:ArsR family transcriptional regulator, arsenate/arsenite/antimonite-responsive transcriptional repressor
LDASQFNRVAKALADPRRVEILSFIAAHEEITCGAMVERLPIAQPTISHHLKELTNAGLVELRPEGQYNYYRLRADVVSEYIEELRRRLGLDRAVPP